MIGIRVDSNSKIGLGHIMRCISIAKALEKQGEKVIFITADISCRSIVDKNAFESYLLETEYNNLELELDSLIKLIKEKKISKLLVDSYYVTNKYLDIVKGYTNIILINDFFKFRYNCDLIINYNIFSHTVEYNKYYDDKQMLLGIEYAPLRDIFLNYKDYKVSEKVKNILITTGGTDIKGINKKIIDQIIINRELDSLNFNIVIGKYFENYDELKELSSKASNINLLCDISDISDIIDESDIVISAAGFTLYEIASIGVPCIILSNGGTLVGNSFEEKNMMIYAGDISNLDVNKLMNTVIKLSLDYKLRNKLSYNCKKMIDGNGSNRIAEEIIKY